MDQISHHVKKRQYTKTVIHVDLAGKTFKAKGGTQSLDGHWKHMKRGTGQTRATYSSAVDKRIRETQWRHWVYDLDRWVESGKVISWMP